MTNPFRGLHPTNFGTATGAAAVTPSGSDVAAPAGTVALYCGTGGDVALRTYDGEEVTIALANGAVLPLAFTHVRASGTTALGLFALVVR